jgi:hypothetical protein
MNNRPNFLFSLALSILTLNVACGPTYVQQVPVAQQYQYDPGYNPNNVLAEAMLATAIVNGVSGYWGPGHVFYPQAYYGGVPGYYSGGRFHTSQQNYTTVVNNYNVGGREFQRNPTQYAQTHPSSVTKPNYSGPSGSTTGRQTNGAQTGSSKPDYGSGGSISRGASNAQQSAQTKPNYGAGGTTSRGSSNASTPSSASSKPNFGSGGSASRSSSSFSSSSSSRSSSSSSSGRSSRR